MIEDWLNEKDSKLDKLVEFVYRTGDCVFCKSIGFKCPLADSQDEDLDGLICRGCIRENIIGAVNCSVVQ